MTSTPGQALASARAQSDNGPKFGINECKKRCRLAYGVDSDGSQTAAIAWSRTQHRRPVSTDMPIGTLVWWTGGSSGAGHVAIYSGNGYVWSTDIKRVGYFDRVPIEQILRSWPNLRLAGASYDIDGVQVVPTPSRPVAVKPVKVTRVTQARALALQVRELLTLAAEHSGPVRKAAIKAALVALAAFLKALPER